MDLRPISELNVEVTAVVGFDDLIRNPTPPSLLRIAVHQHIPRGCAELRSRLPRYDGVGAGVLHQTQEELRTTARGLSVSPTTTEAAILGIEPVELCLLRVWAIRKFEFDCRHVLVGCELPPR